MAEMALRFAPFETRDTDDDGLTLRGYAAVFDSPTQIRDRLGTFTETIARGAFNDSLQSRTPVLQFDHGTHPVLGSIPLGSIVDLREDDHGLLVEARLHDNWLVEPVRDAIASGSVDGMSFRFSVPEDGDEWTGRGDSRERTITRADLFEVGPVVWPAYRDTEVGVRNQLLELVEARMASEFADLRTEHDSTQGEDADAAEGAAAPTSGDEQQPAPAGMSHNARARVLTLLNIAQGDPS